MRAGGVSAVNRQRDVPFRKLGALAVAGALRVPWRIVLRPGSPAIEENGGCCGVAAGRGSR
jgi:hypothetical protein